MRAQLETRETELAERVEAATEMETRVAQAEAHLAEAKVTGRGPTCAEAHTPPLCLPAASLPPSLSLRAFESCRTGAREAERR